MIQAALLKLLGVGGDWIAAKEQRKVRIEGAKAERQELQIKNGHTWEMTVAAMSSRLMRWTLAIHVLLALDYTIYLAVSGDPDPAKIFLAFNVIPEWFVGLLATMFGWAFASEPIKSVGAKLVSTLEKRGSA